MGLGGRRRPHGRQGIVQHITQPCDRDGPLVGRHGARGVGDAGVARHPEHQGRRVDWQVALRPGQRRRLAPGSAAAQAERRKASTRAKVEHPFWYVKRHFGYTQVRYRGLAKNRTRLCLLLGFANLLLAERAAPA